MNKHSPLLDAVLDRAPDNNSINMTITQAAATFIIEFDQYPMKDRVKPRVKRATDYGAPSLTKLLN